MGYLGTDNYKASHREDVTEVAVSKGKVGQAYTVEKDYGRTLTVASAEVLAEADTVEGLPKGQRLIAVRLESNQVDSIDYDSYENAPVDDFYISYDGSFRSEVGTYQFDKGGYDDPTAIVSQSVRMISWDPVRMQDMSFSLYQRRQKILHFFIVLQIQTAEKFKSM